MEELEVESTPNGLSNAAPPSESPGDDDVGSACDMGIFVLLFVAEQEAAIEQG